MTCERDSSTRLSAALDLLPLVQDPLSPGSVRLLEAMGELSAAPEEVRLIGIAPGGEWPRLPASLEMIRLGFPQSGAQRLRYTHSLLGRAAQRHGAEILLVVGSYPPLRCPIPVAVLDEPDAERSSGLLGRLSEAAGRAALRPAFRLDEAPADFAHEHRCAGGRSIPDSPEWGQAELVLAHGITSANLDLILAAWTWVASASSASLMTLTAHPRLQEKITERAGRLDLGASVVVPMGLEPDQVPALYERASVLLLGGGRLGASPARRALARGLPIAAVDQAPLGEIVGDAGFLVRAGDARALGAACLSILVDGALANQLRERGLKQVARLTHGAEAAGLYDALNRRVAARLDSSRA